MHFSFSRFLSVSSHIPGPTVFVSHFPDVSVFSPYSRSYSLHFSFSRFSVFLAIFQVPFCEFLIFFFFQFYCHLRGPTVCIFFNLFQCFSIYSTSYSVFLIFHVFRFSHHTAGPTVCISHFPCFSVFLAIFQILP